MALGGVAPGPAQVVLFVAAQASLLIFGGIVYGPPAGTTTTTTTSAVYLCPPPECPRLPPCPAAPEPPTSAVASGVSTGAVLGAVALGLLAGVGLTVASLTATGVAASLITGFVGGTAWLNARRRTDTPASSPVTHEGLPDRRPVQGTPSPVPLLW